MLFRLCEICKLFKCLQRVPSSIFCNSMDAELLHFFGTMRLTGDVEKWFSSHRRIPWGINLHCEIDEVSTNVYFCICKKFYFFEPWAGADLVRFRIVLIYMLQGSACKINALSSLKLLCSFAKHLSTERTSNQLFHLKISQSHMNFRFFVKSFV